MATASRHKRAGLLLGGLLLKRGLEKVGQNALGHTPHHEIAHYVRRNDQRLPSHRDRRRPVGFGPPQLRKRDPMSRGHLRSNDERQPPADCEDKRSDGDRRKSDRSGNDVVQSPKAVGVRQAQADLFEGLADSGVDQLGVRRTAAAAWQSNVAGPRIVRPFRAPDEEEGIRFRGENQGDCRPFPLGVRGARRLLPGEPVGEPS